MRRSIVTFGILALLLPIAVAHAASTDQVSDHFNVVEGYDVRANS